MTKEELKEHYSIVDILGRYGLRPNSTGFIQCPFHSGDNHASLKVYKKDFNCFGCGANGDIFTFVQLMEDVDFKEAFRILGGTYEKPTFSSNLAIYRSKAKRRMEEKKRAEKQKEKDLNNLLIDVYQRWVRESEPLSDTWCDCYNALQYQLYIYDELNEVNRGE